MPRAAHPHDGAPARRWQRISVVVLVAVVLPSVLVLLVVWQSPEFSPYDEPAHADYLRRIERGELPRIGDKMLEETVREIQCRTVQGRVNAPCGLPSYEPEIIGAQGYQYEAQQPPLYYVVTAGLRQVARIGPADGFVTSARVTGAAWMSAGLVVFFLACRRLRCRWWPTVVVTALLAISPTVVYQSATVNNDAVALLSGSVALLMFALLRQSVDRRAVLVWSVVAVLLVLLKPTGLIAVGVASAALCLDAALDRRLDRRRALSFAIPTLAGLVAYVGWGRVRDARGIVDYQVVLDALLGFKQVDSFPLDDVVASVTRMFRAYASGGIPTSPPYVAETAMVVMLALLAAAMVVLWAPRGGDAMQRVGGVALLALLATGPAITVLFYLDYSIEGGPTSRYGISLLPLLGVAAASTYRTKRALVALSVAGLIVLIALTVAIWTATPPGDEAASMVSPALTAFS